MKFTLPKGYTTWTEFYNQLIEKFPKLKLQDNHQGFELTINGETCVYSLATIRANCFLELENKCKICNGIGMPSKGYGNAYTEPDDGGRRTILYGKGDLINCLKCQNCGRSWT